MANLTAPVNIVMEYDDDNTALVAASTIIYKGAAVGDNGSGYARPLQAGDVFWGFAKATVDNSSGAAGAKKVQLECKGRAAIPVTGVTGVGDIGDAVYASDDHTFTKTATSNSFIGKIIRWESATNAVVRYDAFVPLIETA